jgi:uncharacterized protein YjbJ (UPF0337 family)
MNMHLLEAKWKQLRGKAKQKWGDLTDDELDRIEGRYEELVGLVQEKYNRTREEAEQEVREFVNNLR